MSQVYLAEHRGSTNWGDRKSYQRKSNQIKCWFLVRGENRSTRWKTSRSRVENQQTQPTYDVRSRNRTRATLVEGQCSHHCANTAPKEMSQNQRKPKNNSSFTEQMVQIVSSNERPLVRIDKVDADWCDANWISATYVDALSSNMTTHIVGNVNTELEREWTYHPAKKHRGR